MTWTRYDVERLIADKQLQAMVKVAAYEDIAASPAWRSTSFSYETPEEIVRIKAE